MGEKLMLGELMGDNCFPRDTSSRDSTRSRSNGSSMNSDKRERSGTLFISSEDQKDAQDLLSVFPGNSSSNRKRQRSPSGYCQVQRKPQPPSIRSINVENNCDVASRDVPWPPETHVVGGNTCSDGDAVKAGAGAATLVGGSFIFGRAAVVEDENGVESDSDRSHRLAYLSSRGYLDDAQLMDLLDASVYEDQENADEVGRGDRMVQELVFVPSSELEVNAKDLRDDREVVDVGAAA